ncbi:Uncharacterised protein [uncultured archaeon]|nr:Uncharacterised protein [uncultured archaeon]
MMEKLTDKEDVVIGLDTEMAEIVDAYVLDLIELRLEILDKMSREEIIDINIFSSQ